MHERFRFKTKDEIIQKALALGFELLAARSCRKSIYGGEDPADRFRFMLETLQKMEGWRVPIRLSQTGTRSFAFTTETLRIKFRRLVLRTGLSKLIRKR